MLMNYNGVIMTLCNEIRSQSIAQFHKLGEFAREQEATVLQ